MRTVFLGATSRVAQLVGSHWPHDTASGGNPLSFARIGGGLHRPWDMAGPVPPLPPGVRAGAVFCFAGVTPKSGGPLSDNRDLALAALAAAQTWGAARCFLLSSAAVYGDPGPGPVGETATPLPGSEYGLAKLAMERAALAQGAPDMTILRLANIAGAGEPFDTARRCPSPAALSLDRFADGGGPVRSFVSPRSLAIVLARLAELAVTGTPLPSILNIAAPRPTAMADLLHAMGRTWHWRSAPTGAIQTVHLCTDRLADLCPLPQEWASAAHLVADLPKDISRK